MSDKDTCRHAEREIKQLEQDYEDEHARFKARGGEIDRLEAEVERLRLDVENLERALAEMVAWAPKKWSTPLNKAIDNAIDTLSKVEEGK